MRKSTTISPESIHLRKTSAPETAVIRKSLMDALTRDPKVTESNISVDIKGSKAVLKGRVPSSMARMAAEYDAWAVRGVGAVHNELRVSSPDREPLPSLDDIRRKALNAIAAEHDLADAKVEITADPGKLTLTGCVRSQEQEQKIRGLALRTPGVLEVINKIAVVPTERHEDCCIGFEMNQRLYENIFIDVNTIDVWVENGCVRLSGYVEKEEDLNKLRNLTDIPGVTNVILDVLVLENQK